MVNCCLDQTDNEALWDTGSQVSLLNKVWLENNGKRLRPISDLAKERLDLRAANGTEIPFEGWIALAVGLPQRGGISR